MHSGVADDVLRQGVQGISDLITCHTMINSDFADVRTVLSAKGMAHMGIGTASGEDRCTEATQQAIKSPLLETTIDGAKGVLINVVGGPTLGMMEVDNATNLITSAVDEEARIIFAMGIDDAMGDDVRVTVIAQALSGRRTWITTPQGRCQMRKFRRSSRPRLPRRQRHSC